MQAEYMNSSQVRLLLHFDASLSSNILQSMFVVREVSLKQTNTQHSGHMGTNSETESMIEIYSKSLVRAIGKVFLIKLS